jgi:hypothetical protein
MHKIIIFKIQIFRQIIGFLESKKVNENLTNTVNRYCTQILNTEADRVHRIASHRTIATDQQNHEDYVHHDFI